MMIRIHSILIGVVSFVDGSLCFDSFCCAKKRGQLVIIFFGLWWFWILDHNVKQCVVGCELMLYVRQKNI